MGQMAKRIKEAIDGGATSEAAKDVVKEGDRIDIDVKFRLKGRVLGKDRVHSGEIMTRIEWDAVSKVVDGAVVKALEKELKVKILSVGAWTGGGVPSIVYLPGYKE